MCKIVTSRHHYAIASWNLPKWNRAMRQIAILPPMQSTTHRISSLTPPHFAEWLLNCHLSTAHLLFPCPSHPPTRQCVTHTTSKHSGEHSAYAAGPRILTIIHIHLPRDCDCSADVSATFPSCLPLWLTDPQPTSWHLLRTRRGATHAYKAPHTSERSRSGLNETFEREGETGRRSFRKASLP